MDDKELKPSRALIGGKKIEKRGSAASRWQRQRVARISPPPFNLETFLKTHKGRPARTKPFELHASALECKALAERAGWINVEVVALCKGVGND